MRCRTHLLATALAVLALPASAAAVQPIDLGPGTHARITTDGAGTGYLTWTENVSGQDTTHFCTLPRNAGACATPHSFTYPSGSAEGSSSGNWPLIAGSARVLVLDSRCCTPYAEKHVYSSGDSGATFDGGTIVGNDNNLGANIFGSALYTPAGAIGRAQESVLTLADQASIGLSFQATGTSGPPSATSASNILTPGDAASGSLARAGDTLVAAWIHIDDQVISWRMWNGSGDVNDQANWTAAAQLDAGNTSDRVRLASGPGGIYAAYATGSGPARILLRKFTGSGWGPPVQISDSGNPGNFDIVQDPNGVLHFAWVDSNGNVEYRYGRDASNSDFTRPQTLLTAQVAGYDDPRLAIAPDGTGWLTWDDGNPSHVRAIPIAPGEPPVNPTGNPNPNGTSALYSGPTRTIKVTIGGSVLTLQLPASCVVRGQSFNTAVGTKAKHKVAKGHKGALSVTQVIFSLDGKKLKKEKHKPFRLKIGTPTLTSGSTHTVSARVTVRVRKAHGGGSSKVTKTLKGKVRIC